MTTKNKMIISFVVGIFALISAVACFNGLWGIHVHKVNIYKEIYGPAPPPMYNGADFRLRGEVYETIQTAEPIIKFRENTEAQTRAIFYGFGLAEMTIAVFALTLAYFYRRDYKSTQKKQAKIVDYE